MLGQFASRYRPPRVPTVDAVGATERARAFQTRSIKREAKYEGIQLAISMLDLTTLEGMDTPGKVEMLCQKAIHPHSGDSDCPAVAAVCVYPPFVKLAREYLEHSTVKVASVATYFPSGQATLEERIDEVRRVVDDGAQEIDMVINRGAFLAGEYGRVFDEIAATVEACGSAHLKVILETGEIETLDRVRLAGQIAIDAGAHFIKTSTGKIAPAATLPVTLVMLETVRDHFLKTGNVIGVKPAGGIRTTKQAMHYLAMVKETLGDAWLHADRFRFGASSLLNDLLAQREKHRTGRYHSERYLSLS